MTTGNWDLMPSSFSPTDADGSFGGMDWSLPSDYGMPLDLTDPMFRSQYELDPAVPPLLLDPSEFGFPAGYNAFVDPSQLRKFPPVSPGTTPPPLTAPFIYTSQTEASPQPPAQPSPAQQDPPTHKQRIKKLEDGFPCTHPGCTKRFDRACDLRKHAGRTHTPQDKRQWKCPQPGCNKRFIWPKDVARHQRQVHGVESHSVASSSPPPQSYLLSPATTRASGRSSHSTNSNSGSSSSNPSTLPPEKSLSGPPAKRQRQLLSALPGKLSTTLWLCRSVVLLKGLRIRRKSTRSEATAADDDDDDGDLDAPGEVVDEECENECAHTDDAMAMVTATAGGRDTAPPSSLLLPPPPPLSSTTAKIAPTKSVTITTGGVSAEGTMTAMTTAAAAPKRWLLITYNRKDFRAVEITGAASAGEVMGRVRRAVGPSAHGLELAVRELSLYEGERDELSGEGLMKAVDQRAGEGNGLMLLLTKKGAAAAVAATTVTGTSTTG